jgi:hypothetical protein
MPTCTILHFLAFSAELVALVLLPLLRYFLVTSVAFHDNSKIFALNQDKLFLRYSLPAQRERRGQFVRYHS